MAHAYNSRLSICTYLDMKVGKLHVLIMLTGFPLGRSSVVGLLVPPPHPLVKLGKY